MTGEPKQSKNSIQSKAPRLIDTAGELSTTIDINDQDVPVCGVTFQDKQFLFGGRDEKVRQILEIDNCRLNNVGSLPFDNKYSTCGSTYGLIIICFIGGGDTGDDDFKICQQASHSVSVCNPYFLKNDQHRFDFLNSRK